MLTTRISQYLNTSETNAYDQVSFRQQDGSMYEPENESETDDSDNHYTKVLNQDIICTYANGCLKVGWNFSPSTKCKRLILKWVSTHPADKLVIMPPAQVDYRAFSAKGPALAYLKRVMLVK